MYMNILTCLPPPSHIAPHMPQKGIVTLSNVLKPEGFGLGSKMKIRLHCGSEELQQSWTQALTAAANMP